MKKAKTVAVTAISGLLAMGMGANTDVQAAKPGMEKCMGIANMGMNDCGTSKHGCAGQAKKSGAPDEWIYVKKGTCEKIVGGKLKKG